MVGVEGYYFNGCFFLVEGGMGEKGVGLKSGRFGEYVGDFEVSVGENWRES